MASVNKREGYGWQVRYIDPSSGKRPSKTFELKKDAEAFKRKVEREIEDGMLVSSDKARSVEKVIDEYLVNSQTRVKDGRLGQERAYNIDGQLRKHVIPAIGRVIWRDLKADQVEAIYRAMIGKSRLKPSYAREVLTTLRMIESFAVKRGYAKAKPVLDAMNELRGIPRTKQKHLSIEAAASVLRLSLEHQPKADRHTEALFSCFVHLAGCCGMRIGEIIALKTSSIDLESGTIHVRNNMTTMGRMKAPKTKDGERDLPLPDHLRAMVGAWLADHHIPNDLDLAFTTRKGERCKHSSLSKNWHKLLSVAGLLHPGDAYHFHALRHFAGSWWLANGMTIPDVSKLLGHSDPAFTMRVYIHTLSKNSERSAAVRSNANLLVGGGDAVPTAFRDPSVTHHVITA